MEGPKLDHLGSYEGQQGLRDQEVPLLASLFVMGFLGLELGQRVFDSG